MDTIAIITDSAPTWLLAFLLVACGADGPDAPETAAPTPETTEPAPGLPDDVPDVPLDVAPDTPPDPPLPPIDEPLHMDLTLDLTALTGVASLSVPAGEPEIALAAAGLTIESVTAEGEAPLDWSHIDGVLSVTRPDPATATAMTVTYAFASVPKGTFEGYMESGSTLLWPEHCQNLFPCRPHPTHALTFSVTATGLPDGQSAVTATVEVPAPAYSVAVAVGEYEWTSLGVTSAGTEVGQWQLPTGQEKLAKGTADLVAIIEWLETTLGPYRFGPRLGPVPVTWGAFSYGGIENHPFWHVSSPAAGDPQVHAHEAAHGWFGNGVRLACWEDLVLSEGTANYLAVRAITEVMGPEAGEAIWLAYTNRLLQLLDFGIDHVAWLDTCTGKVDVLDELFSQIPYVKGAFFYRAVAEEVGVYELDGVLGAFYQTYLHRAATMSDLLDAIAAQTGFDPWPLAELWLRSLGMPEGFSG